MIYVDDKQIPYGRMKMCHMLADTTAELEDMARKIGVAVRHIEYRGEPNEHLNISQAYRTKAIREGAVEIDSRGLVKLIRQKRRMTPEERAGKDCPGADMLEGDEPDTSDIPEQDETFFENADQVQHRPGGVRIIRREESDEDE